MKKLLMILIILIITQVPIVLAEHEHEHEDEYDDDQRWDVHYDFVPIEIQPTIKQKETNNIKIEQIENKSIKNNKNEFIELNSKIKNHLNSSNLRYATVNSYDEYISKIGYNQSNLENKNITGKTVSKPENNKISIHTFFSKLTNIFGQ